MDANVDLTAMLDEAVWNLLDGLPCGERTRVVHQAMAEAAARLRARDRCPQLAELMQEAEPSP